MRRLIISERYHTISYYGFIISSSVPTLNLYGISHPETILFSQKEFTEMQGVYGRGCDVYSIKCASN